MADSPVAYAFDDIVDLEVSDDDVLASEFEVGNSLPELSSADILGLHANEDAFEEALLGNESHDAEVEDADLDDAVHLHVQEAIEALLHLNSDQSAPTLQGQRDSEMTTALLVLTTPRMMTMTTSCMTSETMPVDDSQTTNGIDLLDNDNDYDSDNSGRWSTEVNPPDDAVWCMSNVLDWEAGFNAWCTVHQGQAFHRMLPHCIIQCTVCLSTFSLTTDGFWYSQN